MEVHRQYNLRSTKNSDTFKTHNPGNFSKKSPEIDPRKIVESLKKIAKNPEEINPEILTRKPPINPRKTISTFILKKNQLAEVAAKIIPEKIDLSLPKT